MSISNVKVHIEVSIEDGDHIIYDINVQSLDKLKLVLESHVDSLIKIDEGLDIRKNNEDTSFVIDYHSLNGNNSFRKEIKLEDIV